MYSPSLESLIKSIQNAQPLPDVKPKDSQSPLPFNLFPKMQKSVVSKTVFCIADANSNAYVVETLINSLQTNRFSVQYYGPVACTFNGNIKTVSDLQSALKAEPDIILMFGFVSACVLSAPSAKTYLILDRQVGMYDDAVERLNKTIDGIYVFSENHKELLICEGVCKPITIIKFSCESLATESENIDAIKAQMGIQKDAFVIVNSCGKRFDTALVVFAKLIALYPDLNMILLCLADNNNIVEIFKHELMRNKLAAATHIGKLFFTTNSKQAFAVADIGLHTNDQDELCSDFLELDTYGKPQIIPDFGFYKDFISSEIHNKIDIQHMVYEPSEHSLAIKFVLNHESLLKALCALLEKGKTCANVRKIKKWTHDFNKYLL